MNPRVIPPEILEHIFSDKYRNRFWSHIKIGGMDECWPWLKSLDYGGYGHVGAKSLLFKTHRIAFILSRNCDIPEGMDVLHSCVASRTCCNPFHLRFGDDVDNTADKITQGRLFIPMVKGERHGMRKLTDEKIRDYVFDKRKLITHD